MENTQHCTAGWLPEEVAPDDVMEPNTLSNLDNVPYVSYLKLRQRSPSNENDMFLRVYPPTSVELSMI